MITANQIKDKVAQRYGFSTWYHIPVGQRQELVNECINEALNEQLNKPLVMQAEGSDGVSGAAVGNSAAGKGVCGGLTKCIKFDNGQGYCDLCGEKI